jgi:ABC-type transport system involved in multi-copper enzyme maturation permease subunit
MSVVFVGTLTWKNNWVVDLNLLKGVMMIFFQLMILGSVAMLFSVFTTPVVNFFMTSAVYIIGNLSDYTLTMTRSDSFVVKWFYMIVHYLTPNFANFNTQNPLIHPEVPIRGELVYYGVNILQALMWTSVLLIISVLAFEKRDM